MDGNALEDFVDDEEQDERVMELFRSLQLQGGTPHSSLIIAVAKGSLVESQSDGGEHLVGVNWFRIRQAEEFEPLVNVRGSTYQASADDIGARVAAQCYDVRNPAVCRFTEVGPLLPDGKLVSAAEAAFYEKRLMLPQVLLRVASVNLESAMSAGVDGFDGSGALGDPFAAVQLPDNGFANTESDTDESGGGDAGFLSLPHARADDGGVDASAAAIARLPVHEVSLELTPGALTIMACESDTPRGLVFSLAALRSPGSAQGSASISADQSSSAPLSVVLHPAEPTRVDIVISGARTICDCLDWMGDTGGELWGYMALKRTAAEATVVETAAVQGVDPWVQQPQTSVFDEFPDHHAPSSTFAGGGSVAHTFDPFDGVDSTASSKASNGIHGAKSAAFTATQVQSATGPVNLRQSSIRPPTPPDFDQQGSMGGNPFAQEDLLGLNEPSSGGDGEASVGSKELDSSQPSFVPPPALPLSASATQSMPSMVLHLEVSDPHTRDLLAVVARAFVPPAAGTGDRPLSDESSRDTWDVPWRGLQLSGELDQTAALRLEVDELKAELALRSDEALNANEMASAARAKIDISDAENAKITIRLRRSEAALTEAVANVKLEEERGSKLQKSLEKKVDSSEAEAQAAVTRAEAADAATAAVRVELRDTITDLERRCGEAEGSLKSEKAETERLRAEQGHWKRKAESLRKECERGARAEERVQQLTKQLKDAARESEKLSGAIEIAQQEGAAYKQALEHALTVRRNFDFSCRHCTQYTSIVGVHEHHPP